MCIRDSLWEEEDVLRAKTTRPEKVNALFTNFNLAIVGPGGTGKTAVLKVTEALINFFAGPETVQKLAPSNAAARLFGGDTIHAVCKLPFGKATLSSKTGRLTKPALTGLRRQWRNIIAAFLDEVSMIAADQFLQCDVRMRQAKQTTQQPFGGLAVNVCGDFLQLPPVDKDGSRHSLARPFDDTGHVAPDGDEEAQATAKAAHAESRQGFELWRSIAKVVCLNVNVRAPDALGKLQEEMRAGQISDETWAMYLSRRLEPGDDRLSKGPFAKSSTQFIVHRHSIRVMRSFENAKERSRELREPLHMVQAKDEAVRVEDAPKMTDEVMKELLRRVNPDKTKGLPSFLPLHRHMRLLLSSKDCVRLGIMKGCPVILRDIVSADKEEISYEDVAGHARSLQFMPTSLLLQAEGVALSLIHI